MPAAAPGGAPTLSVITPSFNSARFIGETLDSVAALNPAHEHLVFDGGSSDETVEILAGRADESLSWVSEPDRGQTHAVNKGLERARGELIGWLNADDAYKPAAVDRAVAALVADPGLDAVFGFIEIVDAGGRLQKLYRCGPFNWTRYLYFGDYLPTPTIIFRRTLLDRAAGLDERWVDAADYDFFLRLLRGARVRRMREPLVRFRYHHESKTASNPGLQRRESLEIRLRYARNPLDRAVMRGINRASELRNSVLNPWPELPSQ